MFMTLAYIIQFGSDDVFDCNMDFHCCKPHLDAARTVTHKAFCEDSQHPWSTEWVSLSWAWRRQLCMQSSGCLCAGLLAQLLQCYTRWPTRPASGQSFGWYAGWLCYHSGNGLFQALYQRHFHSWWAALPLSSRFYKFECFKIKFLGLRNFRHRDMVLADPQSQTEAHLDAAKGKFSRFQHQNFCKDSTSDTWVRRTVCL